MFDETHRKELVLEYIRRVNVGDAKAICEMLAENVRFEEPIGAQPRQGREEMIPVFTQLAAARMQVTPSQPVAAPDGRHVALSVVANMVDPTSGKRISMNCIEIFRVDDDGLFDEVKVFWGGTDIYVQTPEILSMMVRPAEEGEGDAVLTRITP